MRIRVPIKRIAGFCKHWVSIPKRRQRAAVNKRGPFYTEHTLTEGGGGPRRPEEGSALGKRLFLHSKDGRGAGGGGRSYISTPCSSPLQSPHSPQLVRGEGRGFGRLPLLLSLHPAPASWGTVSLSLPQSPPISITLHPAAVTQFTSVSRPQHTFQFASPVL